VNVPVIERLGPCLDGYDVLFCDVWGVVHNGVIAFAEAGEALARFREQGGTVILVSNAPVPHEGVASLLAEKGVRRDAWDAIVSSGDLTLAFVESQGYRALHRIGPKRDSRLFDRLPGASATVVEADAIVCTGLLNDTSETAEHYRPLLAEALTHRLPFVCANPDLVVDVGGRRFLCAGSIAALYEQMGGLVHWAGKPYAPAYAAASALAERLRGARIPKARILAIGDAVRTDIEGARRAGIGALFVAGGIHREDVMSGDRIVPERLAELFQAPEPRPIGAMTGLRW
jgi:HAD superfamily hydrolase (TIGR01459 family)